MKFTELDLPGAWLIEPEAFTDERGTFFRNFCAEEFAAHGLVPTAVQGNVSVNPRPATLRGFHYQKPPFEESKTLSCMTGAIYDIVVDLRPASLTFMKWHAESTAHFEKEESVFSLSQTHFVPIGIHT